MPDHAKRAHAVLSPSSAERWIHCPPSALLADQYPRQDTPFTAEGTRAHEVAEAVTYCHIYDHEIHPQDGDTQEMIDCARGWSDYVLGLAPKDAAIFLEQRVDLTPWVPDCFGTADALIMHDSVMEVCDYKYGQGVPVSAVGNPQLRLYALGALNIFGLAYDIETVRMHIYQPRLGSISVDEIKADDLLAWADTVVKPAADLAIDGSGELAAGRHCRFCPHAGRCTALAESCLSFRDSHGATKQVRQLTPEDLRQILDREQEIETWLKKVKAAAMDILTQGGDVPGYKMVMGRGSRAWSDETAVVSALDAAGVPRDQYTETAVLSPAAMEKALGKKKAAELVGGLITKKDGAPQLAPVDDKRPAYNRAEELKKEF